MDESNASSLSWAPLGESPVLTPQVGLFTGTLASGNHTGAWLTDHSHVRGVRHAPGWTGLTRHLGSIGEEWTNT